MMVIFVSIVLVGGADGGSGGGVIEIVLGVIFL